jgi:uncharacterized protein YuzE
MRLHYYQETDSLYIEFSEKVGADSQEVAPGVVVDFDAEGMLVGIDSDQASRVANLSRLEVEGISISSLSLSR